MSAILVFLSGFALVALVKLWQNLSPRYRSSLRHLRGPRGESFLLGNFMQAGVRNQALQQEWIHKYGPNVKLHGILNVPYLFTVDMKAIHHIVTHYMDYRRPEPNRQALARSVGHGLLVSEGEQHRNQRRVLNPAFGPAQVRELTEIFLEKALHLCDYWTSRMSEDGSLRTNVNDGLSKMTLDVIGFNYAFDALQTGGEVNELNLAFQAISASPEPSAWQIIRRMFPFLNLLSNPSRRADNFVKAHQVMRRIGTQLIEEKKAQIMTASGEKGTRTVEKKDVQGRDLLSLLIKANMAADIPESQRLTDEEVLAQVPTFLVAGHETTSQSASWTLFALCKHPHFQQKLREELLAVDTDTPTMEELNDLPFLDQVVRETLRLHPPVVATTREASHEDVIPVSEPFTDARGKVQHGIEVAPGNRIIMSIYALQTSKQIWGEDALEYKPGRWANPPETIANMPGVWGHLLTFSGGPRACIGYRFSLVELKALLFTLLRAFEFELAVPAEDVEPFGLFIQRPGVRGQKGAGLPLIIRPYNRA